MSLVQSLWVEGRMSRIEHMCLRSFVRAGHECHVYTYDSAMELPEGVIRRNGEEILSVDTVFRNTTGSKSYAAFSDLFRYQLLYRNGGWWVDTDLFCLKSFVPLENRYVLGWQRMQYDEEDTVGSAAIYVQAERDPLMEKLFEEAHAVGVPKEWDTIGPALLKKKVQEHALESYLVKPEIFFPLDYWKFREMEKSWNIPADSYAIHLWNEMLRFYKWDKESDRPADSLLGHLQRVVE